jgi:tripartite ATP-independent transporter DctM subunit
MDLLITALLVLSLFAILGSGVWIGLALSGVAWIGMTLFSSRPAGDAMAVTIWGSSSSWTLTALPLFIWMGEILFRTRLSEDMFKGLAPWLEKLPGRLLHTNVIGCAIFAAVSGSSAATCATIGKMTLPELTKRGYPEDVARFIAMSGRFQPLEFAVGRFVLFSSKDSVGGGPYLVEQAYPLAA